MWSLEHEDSVPPHKKIEIAWRCGLPKDLAKDFHGFDKTEKNAVKTMLNKVGEKDWRLLYRAVRYAVDDWWGFRDYTASAKGMKHEKIPEDPNVLFCMQYLNELMNFYLANEVLSV